jgi:hypothetical protein
MVDIRLSGIVIIVGNYGSGKTETAINLAVYHRRAGLHVRIADLDLVNPYFRTREARKALTDLGIDVVLPPDRYLHADLPVLSPVVSGLIRRPGELTLLDVGGNDVGAMVLAALGDAFKDQTFRMLQVVNPSRPFTSTVAGCLQMRRKIETAAKLRINGLIGNANLMDETTVDDICRGYDFVTALSVESRLPLEFITATSELISRLDVQRFSCPVLPIERQLVLPWMKAVPLRPMASRP